MPELWAFTVTPTPSPSPSAATDVTLGSPGLLGFIVLFALAVMVIVLLRSMVTHLRRANHRAADEGPDAGVEP